jgi:cell division protease FtsH
MFMTDDIVTSREEETPESTEFPDPELSRKSSADAASAAKKPRRGFTFIAVLLTVLLGIAALQSNYQDDRVIERNSFLVEDLFKAGAVDPTSLVYLRDTQTLKGRFTQAQANGKKSFEIRFSSEEETNTWRQYLSDYNNDVRKASGQPPVDWTRKESDRAAWQLFWASVPWIVVLLFLYFIFVRQLRGPGAGNVFTFGRSRAKLATSESVKVTFADVAGIEEAQDEVSEIVEFLKNPKKFQRLGGRIPRGVMLVGAPGTGKTLLAKAIAGEAGVPFFSICGSDFVEMFAGVGASRVRDLFRQARDNSPCIIFLDEVDAVGRRRGTGLGGGHDEREQTLNAILVEMDGFVSDEGIIVVAATNRPDVLDPALLRPGRFDRQIAIDLPDVAGREHILRVHSRNVKVHPSTDLTRIARATPTFSGAELAALVNEAAIIAVMQGHEAVLESDMEEARDKIRWGRQKKSRELFEADRRITAYHEAGHAIVAHLIDAVEPLHKVTIIPRGKALGATMQLPERDRYHFSRKQVHGNLMMLYAGRIAEELFCDDITSGASNDIERATDLARRMVCEWGMSDDVGPINYSDGEETLFLGREVTRTRNHSETVALRIDEEVRRVIDEAYRESEKLLRKYREAIVRIADGLLAKETLSGEEVAALVRGERLKAPTTDEAGSDRAPALEEGEASGSVREEVAGNAKRSLFQADPPAES